MSRSHLYAAVLSAFLAACGGAGGEALPAQAQALDGRSLVNPLVAATPGMGSADPSVVYRDGYYHYCRVLEGNAIGIARAARLQDIGQAPMVTVWRPPPGTAYSHEVWAPELQHLQGRWYIYFAASDGHNANHRMHVLEAPGADALQGYVYKGPLATSEDRWAIDGTAFEHDGKLYFVWSGWRGANDGFPQVTYIAPMANPWTLSGERREIAAPDLPWEQRGGALMEGPAVLQRDGRLFLTYSASGSWTDDYALGLLVHTGGDVLDPASWRKSPQPVFTRRTDGGAEGPGHNAFVTSPDGRQNWIVYHAIDHAGGGWTQRSVRAQPFTWRSDGLPDFGTPVAPGVPIPSPSDALR